MEEKINIRATASVLEKFKTDWRAKKRYDRLMKSMHTPCAQTAHSKWKEGEDPRDRTRY